MSDTEQVKRPVGRPKTETRTIPLAVRLDEGDYMAIPRNAKGNPDQEWLRAAIRSAIIANSMTEVAE